MKRARSREIQRNLSNKSEQKAAEAIYLIKREKWDGLT